MTVIGMDPHKRSATIEIIDHTARILATGRYTTDMAGYSEMRARARHRAGFELLRHRILLA
ncbi:hypothetical protein [Nocardia tengchongensis]